MYFVIALIALFLIAYLFSYYKLNPIIVLALKIVASFLFMVLAFICYRNGGKTNDNYSVLILVGLACGFFGDIILGMRRVNAHRKQEYFILGLIMFLIGHSVYAIAFYEYSNTSIFILIPIALGFSALIILSLWLLRIDFKSSRLLAYLYIFLSGMILTITATNAISYSVFSILASLGAALFVLSDYILCIIYFRKMRISQTKILKYINILAYYGAQVLFAMTLFYMT